MSIDSIENAFLQRDFVGAARDAQRWLDARGTSELEAVPANDIDRAASVLVQASLRGALSSPHAVTDALCKIYDDGGAVDRVPFSVLWIHVGALLDNFDAGDDAAAERRHRADEARRVLCQRLAVLARQSTTTAVARTAAYVAKQQQEAALMIGVLIERCLLPRRDFDAARRLLASDQVETRALTDDERQQLRALIDDAAQTGGDSGRGSSSSSHSGGSDAATSSAPPSAAAAPAASTAQRYMRMIRHLLQLVYRHASSSPFTIPMLILAVLLIRWRRKMLRFLPDFGTVMSVLL